MTALIKSVRIKLISRDKHLTISSYAISISLRIFLTSDWLVGILGLGGFMWKCYFFHIWDKWKKTPLMDNSVTNERFCKRCGFTQRRRLQT